MIDLLAGRAVHARGGNRAAYRAVERAAGVAIDGDAGRLASVYVEQLGVRELYVADLDAIGGARLRRDAIARIVACGAPVWLDAGVTSVDRARQAVAAGAARVIVGLETLRSWPDLAAICSAVDGHRVAFSLDLRAGEPIVAAKGRVTTEPIDIMARRAADAGAGAVIVLDLARVGAGAGVDLEVMAAVRKAIPGVMLVGGGGVRDAADLQRLGDAGGDAALVATALLDGRLGPHQSVSR